MRLTAEVVSLTNAHIEQPPAGSRVLALTRGGKLVEAIWRSSSLGEYDGWCMFPKVPDDVKQIQSERYK